tara:strand:+ start:25010 stop:25201 length:192 start_codon:yes stop_codon:yes gene_type:complete
MNSQQIIYASEVEEFFWEDSNEPVEEGTPIGYEVSSSDDPSDPSYKIVLVLLSDIYYEAQEEI